MGLEGALNRCLSMVLGVLNGASTVRQRSVHGSSTDRQRHPGVVKFRDLYAWGLIALEGGYSGRW